MDKVLDFKQTSNEIPYEWRGKFKDGGHLICKYYGASFVVCLTPYDNQTIEDKPKYKASSSPFLLSRTRKKPNDEEIFKTLLEFLAKYGILVT